MELGDFDWRVEREILILVTFVQIRSTARNNSKSFAEIISKGLVFLTPHLHNTNQYHTILRLRCYLEHC